MCSLSLGRNLWKCLFASWLISFKTKGCKEKLVIELGEGETLWLKLVERDRWKMDDSIHNRTYKDFLLFHLSRISIARLEHVWWKASGMVQKKYNSPIILLFGWGDEGEGDGGVRLFLASSSDDPASCARSARSWALNEVEGRYLNNSIIDKCIGNRLQNTMCSMTEDIREVETFNEDILHCRFGGQCRRKQFSMQN